MEKEQLTPSQKGQLTRQQNRPVLAAAQARARAHEAIQRDAIEWAWLEGLGAGIAAMPDDDFFGKWRVVPGYGQRMRERWSKEQLTFWVTSDRGARELTGHMVQRHWYTQEWGTVLLPACAMNIIYTHDSHPTGQGWGAEYLHDYSPRATDLRRLAGATAEELQLKANALIDVMLQKADEEFKKFQRMMKLYSNGY